MSRKEKKHMMKTPENKRKLKNRIIAAVMACAVFSTCLIFGLMISVNNETQSSYSNTSGSKTIKPAQLTTTQSTTVATVPMQITTVQPTTVQPTTVQPTTVQITTVQPTTEPITTIEEDVQENYSWDGEVLTPSAGRIQGPSGEETYYNLPMEGVIESMRSMGFDYDYAIRDDGVRLFGGYVMIAANLNIRPKGTLVPTSLGLGIVCDTGGFADANPYQIDIAVTW